MKQVTFDESDIKKLVRIETKWHRFWRLTGRTIRQLLYLVILFFIFFYAINFGAYLKRFHYSIAAKPAPVKVEPTPEPVKPAEPLPDYAPAIEIPKLGLSAPLITNIGPSDVLANLKNGVIQYLDTAMPGEIGNMVIVGHSSDFPWSDGHYKTIFALIDKLAPGDQIIVPFHSQKYIYEVTDHVVVKPTDLSVLKKTDTATLTLLTCYPVGTTRSRYIVHAKLVSDNISGTQLREPAVSAIPTPR